MLAAVNLCQNRSSLGLGFFFFFLKTLKGMDNDAFHSQLFAMARTLVSPVPDHFGTRQPAVHFHHVDG